MTYVFITRNSEEATANMATITSGSTTLIYTGSSASFLVWIVIDASDSEVAHAQSDPSVYVSANMGESA